MRKDDGDMRLREKLNSGKIMVAPGIYDFISLKIADQLNFDCLYMSGYGTVASYLGLPDAGLATYTDMLNRVRAFCESSSTPIICDGDTGYGGLLNVFNTVEGYIKAGAAGIQLEDQDFPKKCGHTKGRRLISSKDMEAKIKVAVDARADSDDFLIVARTDARSSEGLDEALRRAENYLAAGADVLFVESPESEDELRIIGETLKAPLIVNIVEGGRTPQPSLSDLEKMGFSLAIHPCLGFLSAGKALRDAFSYLKHVGDSIDYREIDGFEDFNKLIGFQKVWDFDEKYAGLDG
ncbi:isocitrate lyase/PEP mutase family protein [Vandammella animalimorsus]|nr:isocitrate lyase/PEP mutase family protein [Vandammella animalimorsus]